MSRLFIVYLIDKIDIIDRCLWLLNEWVKYDYLWITCSYLEYRHSI